MTVVDNGNPRTSPTSESVFEAGPAWVKSFSGVHKLKDGRLRAGLWISRDASASDLLNICLNFTWSYLVLFRSISLRFKGKKSVSSALKTEKSMFALVSFRQTADRREFNQQCSESYVQLCFRDCGQASFRKQTPLGLSVPVYPRCYGMSAWSSQKG